MTALASIYGSVDGGGPCFLIDEQQHVVGWPEAAAKTRGIPPSRALGRPCWELRGPRGRGRGLPPPACRRCALLAPAATTEPGGAPCVILPLPGCATTIAWPPEWAAENDSFFAVPKLALLGALCSVLEPDDLPRSFDRAVRLLRGVLAADDCELFLRDPAGGDMLLAACAGGDQDALMTRERFEPGIGYPGLAAATGRVLRTSRLVRDHRFLRRAVTRRGISSYVCLPVAGSGRPLGCLCAAWKNQDVPVGRVAGLLAEASAPIGMAVRAGLSAVREHVEVLFGGGHAGASDRQAAFLDAIVRASGTRGATIVLPGVHGGAPIVRSTLGAPRICERVLAGGVPECPILASSHGQVLGTSRREWPPACRQLASSTKSPCCLSLQAGDGQHGMVMLDYGAAPPAPLHHDLVPLLAMVREAAPRLAPAPGQAMAATPRRVLELRCFGRFEVRLHGAVLPPAAFARRKALALLKALVIAPGKPIHRDALVERLWPEADAASGANRLHGVVHALRCAVEPFARERRWIYIRNRGEFYHFDAESPHWIDLHAFHRRIARGARALEEGCEEDALVHLQQALELYRGDLFEDGDEAEWCARVLVEEQQRFVDVTLQLAELWSGRGETERSVRCLRRGLGVDPLREDIHQVLIQTLADDGRRGEALEQCREFARLLRAELGVEPLPATRRLERMLVAGAGL